MRVRSRRPTIDSVSDPPARAGEGVELEALGDPGFSRLGAGERTAVAFEAGRDGFWLARWLRARGIEVTCCPNSAWTAGATPGYGRIQRGLAGD
jgi:hypothetical protein